MTEDVIKNRLETAKSELSKLSEYDYIVVNGTDMIDEAAREIIGIVNAEKLHVSRAGDFQTKFFA